MKIRNRLSSVFTISVVLILLAMSVLVYSVSATARKNDFYNRLKERVNITEQLFLEKDRLSTAMLENIRERFLHTLPSEVEVVKPLHTIGTVPIDSLCNLVPGTALRQLLAEGYAEFQLGNVQGVAQAYHFDGREWAVVVTAIDAYGIAQTRTLRYILLIGGLIGSIAFFVSSRMLARQALKPIAIKIRKAQGIGAANLDQRLNVSNKNDELGQLAIAFNGLLDRLQHAFELQRNFVRNASHELRNPLTSIIGEAEVAIEKERSQEEYRASLTSIAREAHRLNLLVNQFLQLTRTATEGSQQLRESIRLDELVLEAKLELDKNRPDNRVRLDFNNLPDDPELLTRQGDASLLRVALVNVLDNAVKFSGNKEVLVELSHHSQRIRVTIHDQGIGIPANEQEQIFQPLYRAENARSFEGSGVGLSMVQRIVELHDGSISITSDRGAGTRVSIDL